MPVVNHIEDIRVALPPRGSTVRDINRKRYGLVIERTGRRCVVRFLGGETRVVYASQLVVVRKVRTVY